LCPPLFIFVFFLSSHFFVFSLLFPLTPYILYIFTHENTHNFVYTSPNHTPHILHILTRENSQLCLYITQTHTHTHTHTLTHTHNTHTHIHTHTRTRTHTHTHSNTQPPTLSHMRALTHALYS